jgi:hypothetical protein
MDAKIASQEPQGLLSSEIQTLLVDGLRIAVPIAVPVIKLERKEIDDVVKNALSAVEYVIGAKKRRCKAAEASKTICGNNLWVKEIKPSVSLEKFKELKTTYLREKPLFPWMLNLVWSTRGEPTEKLFERVENAPNDSVRGQYIVEFICNTENQDRGSGFCEFLWKEVRKSALFPSENPANRLPLPSDQEIPESPLSQEAAWLVSQEELQESRLVGIGVDSQSPQRTITTSTSSSSSSSSSSSASSSSTDLFNPKKRKQTGDSNEDKYSKNRRLDEDDDRNNSKGVSLGQGA